MSKSKGKSNKTDTVNPNNLLRPEERACLSNRIRVQLLSLENDGGMPIEKMESIKKLHIMLDLFEKFGKEFDVLLDLPDLQDRYLDVRLRVNKNKPSVVIIKHGKMPEERKTSDE